MKLAPLDGLGETWWLSNVYGPTAREEKSAFLQELRVIRTNCPGPWLLCGDFNLIYKASDKNNGRLHHGIMRSFRSALDDLQLEDLHLSGRLFTWSNETYCPRWNSLTVLLPWWNGWNNTPVTKCGVSRLTVLTTPAPTCAQL